MILVEQIGRLARLNQADWDTLKRMLLAKKLSILNNFDIECSVSIVNVSHPMTV